MKTEVNRGIYFAKMAINEHVEKITGKKLTMDAPLGKKALDEKIKIDAAKKVVVKIEKDKPEIIDRDS